MAIFLSKIVCSFGIKSASFCVRLSSFIGSVSLHFYVKLSSILGSERFGDVSLFSPLAEPHQHFATHLCLAVPSFLTMQTVSFVKVRFTWHTWSPHYPLALSHLCWTSGHPNTDLFSTEIPPNMTQRLLPLLPAPLTQLHTYSHIPGTFSSLSIAPHMLHEHFRCKSLKFCHSDSFWATKILLYWKFIRIQPGIECNHHD